MPTFSIHIHVITVLLQFTGKWNAVARLRNSGQLESGVIGIKFNKPGEYLAYMTGAV